MPHAMPIGLDPLPSWNDGEVKRSILAFVRAVCAEHEPGFVPVDERVAVFDNDGTLWCEQPMPVQGFFTLDRVKVIAAQKPELRQREPFKTILDGDRAQMAKFGKRELVELLMATHSGMTIEQFDSVAKDWFARAMHPRFGRAFTACTYQPMLELLQYLAACDFRVFVVSGGGVDFMRAVTTDLYGLPTDHVIGSSGKTRYVSNDGEADLIKLPELDTFDDHEGKPIDIHRHIGQRPIFAFGNSDGDLPMLHYTASGAHTSMALLLHHDDAQREYAYDRDFKVSPLNAGLAEARAHGWLVSMQRDFARVFA